MWEITLGNEVNVPGKRPHLNCTFFGLAGKLARTAKWGKCSKENTKF